MALLTWVHFLCPTAHRCPQAGVDGTVVLSLSLVEPKLHRRLLLSSTQFPALTGPHWCPLPLFHQLLQVQRCPLGPGGEENEASRMVLSWQLQKCTTEVLKFGGLEDIWWAWILFGRGVGAQDTDPRVIVVGAGAGLVDPEADIIRLEKLQVQRNCRLKAGM